MKFSEFENTMRKIGLRTLADVARKFKTTPQAVSNWKSRDQVPYHIVASINDTSKNELSPKEINATIKKKRATVINIAKPAPAKYLLNSKAFSTNKRTGLKIFSTACIEIIEVQLQEKY